MLRSRDNWCMETGCVESKLMVLARKMLENINVYKALLYIEQY